jgi:hypothetical protein
MARTTRKLACAMASEPKRRSFPTPNRIVFGALAAWIGVVVVGAGSSVDDSLLGVDHLEIVWLIILAMSAMLGLVLLIALNPFSKEWSRPEKRRSFGIWTVLLLALVVVVLRPGLLDNLIDDQDQERPTEVVDVDPLPDVEAEDELETVAQATDLLLLLAGVGATAGLWILMRRWLADSDGVDSESIDEAFEVDLIAALEQLTTELGESSDPREAVLRSYAVLETMLASHGSQRAKAETPTEHLRRSLKNLRVDATPLIHLGSLYEIARFSDEAISAAQQHDAAEALLRARTALAARA